jgi:hypothetical protein
MAVDPNEIGGWVRECTNVAYLRGLKGAIDERLTQLGAPVSVPPPVPLTLEAVRNLRDRKEEAGEATAPAQEVREPAAIDDLPPAPPLPEGTGQG